jgi:hypothetical protein
MAELHRISARPYGYASTYAWRFTQALGQLS